MFFGERTAVRTPEPIWGGGELYVSINRDFLIFYPVAQTLSSPDFLLVNYRKNMSVKARWCLIVLLGPEDEGFTILLNGRDSLPNAISTVPEDWSRHQYRFENPKYRKTTSLS